MKGEGTPTTGGEREGVNLWVQGQALEGVPPRGLYSLWKQKARSWAKSHAADGVEEEEHEGGRLGEAGRVIVAKPGTLDVPCRSRAGQQKPAVPRDWPGVGHANKWARPGFAGWMGYSGAPGRAQQVVSRPVQLDQIQARKALSTGLGEEKLQLCLEGNSEP